MLKNERISHIGREKIRLTLHNRLGHGFRVKVRIVVWEDAKAVTLPSRALFR